MVGVFASLASVSGPFLSFASGSRVHRAHGLYVHLRVHRQGRIRNLRLDGEATNHLHGVGTRRFWSTLFVISDRKGLQVGHVFVRHGDFVVGIGHDGFEARANAFLLQLIEKLPHFLLGGGGIDLVVRVAKEGVEEPHGSRHGDCDENASVERGLGITDAFWFCFCVRVCVCVFVCSCLCVCLCE